MRNKRVLFSLMAATVLAAAGCTPSTSGNAEGKLQVMASFYPLQFIAEKVGGDAVQVTSITPAGAEPHDIEISAKTQADIAQADAVVYLQGFQPSIDKAVKEASPKNIADVSKVVDLVDIAAHRHGKQDDEHRDDGKDATSNDRHDHQDGAHDHENEDAQDGHNHEAAKDEHNEHKGSHGHENTEEEHGHDRGESDHDHEGKEGHHHDIGGKDPHFWLDPKRMEKAVDEVEKVFSEAAPKHKSTFAANAKVVKQQLHDLNERYDTTLKRCIQPTIVVGHEAYGYLASKYRFHQIGVAGIDPEQTTSPARLKEISQVVKDNKLNVIFTESKIQDKDSKVLADDLGIKTQVLDPLEIHSDTSKDYIKVMEDNLEKLSTAMQCTQ
ncbi:MAG: zinc ABC transporter substrate-binding protein [Actinomycetaceae bacterium]|nr:zinc ABC transporter substrate-binding protein [Actinomycetaceae bacterium]